MNEQLFIPEKINVGYQERADTYTKKLAYIIYWDNKGVLRKEKSWRGWIDKGSDGREYKDGQWVINPEKVRGPLDTDAFTNEPMEGFVINRHGGGVRESYSWNARHEFVRVFDPRGFEFEISIANLLYILQESNSIKGKGLEGEFVYAWQGPTLCLLPVNSAEYKKCTVYTKLQDQKVSAKELVPGIIYETKKQEKLIYMGKFKWWSNHWKYREKKYIFSNKPMQIFISIDKKGEYERIQISPLSSLSNIAAAVSTEPIENFAFLMDKLILDKHMSKPVALITKPAVIEFKKASHQYVENFHCPHGLYEVTGDKYTEFHINTDQNYNHNLNGTGKGGYVINGYDCHPIAYVGFRDMVKMDEPFKEHIQRNYNHSFSIFGNNKPKLFTKEEIEEKTFVSLYVRLESGAEIPFNQFS